jgi:hypothetical protein
MDQESMKKLRLDRRLAHRRGWIASEQLERELAALPDVSDKIEPGERESAGEEERRSGDAEPPAASTNEG